MMEPYIGELRIFAFNFIPQGWLPCNGQLLQVNTYQALYAVLGNTFGGTAPTTFALPNLQGKVPIGIGTSSTGTSFINGATAGEAAHVLTIAEIPAHTHTVSASNTTATSKTPANSTWATTPTNNYKPASGSTTAHLAAQAFAIAGNSVGHNNMQPYLSTSICIAVTGVYPTRQ